MKITPLVLTAALAFPLAMLGQTSSSTVSPSDLQFAHKLAQEDMSEINLARLALQKSSNPAVRQYAKNIILSADKSMKQQANKIAQQHQVSLPAGMTSRQKSVYDSLAHKSGPQFDRAYMAYEASQQSKDLQLVRREVKTTKDPQLKSFASAQEQPVRAAAQSARTISSSALSTIGQQ